MELYRLEVWCHERLWCRIEAESPWAREAIADLISRLSAGEGYRLELWHAQEERRILSTQGGHIEVLARQPLLQPLALDSLS